MTKRTTLLTAFCAVALLVPAVALLASAVAPASAALPRERAAVLDWRNDRAGSVRAGMPLWRVGTLWGSPTPGLGCSPSGCTWARGTGLAARKYERVVLTFNRSFRVSGFVVEAGRTVRGASYRKPGKLLAGFRTPEGIRLGSPHSKALDVYGSGILPGQIGSKSDCRDRADNTTACKVVVVGPATLMVVSDPRVGVVRISYYA